MTEKQSTRWLAVLTDFIKLLRIDSKEIAAADDKGSPLDLWRSQKMFLEQVCRGMDEGVRTFYCLKSRQIGVTTLSLVFDVFWLAFHPGTIGALVTDTAKNSAANRRLIVRYIESVPRGFFGKSFNIVENNKDFLTFSNGSRLDLLVAGTRQKKAWGEGVGYVFGHLTEIASYGSKEGIDSFLESLSENHPNRLLIIEGTAKGFNHWRDMWIAAKKHPHTIRTIFLGWWSKDLNVIKKKDPRYAVFGADDPNAEERELINHVEELYSYKVTQEQIAWYRWKTADESSDIRTAHQNQPWSESQAFIQSGFSFFAVRILQNDLSRITDSENPVLYRGYRYLLGTDFHLGVMEQITDSLRKDDIELRIWEDPISEAEYAIGCDPAWGRNDNKDRHAISVWRCFADRLVQVAEYADNNTGNQQCAWVLAHLCGAYRNCQINIELTGGPGRAVMTEFEHLRDRMRSDMYMAKMEKSEYDWDDFLHNARWYLYHRPDSMGSGFAKGWESTGESKFRMMMQIQENHRSGLMHINSVPLVEEMLTVVHDGSFIGAPNNTKDDRVFAAALANIAWLERIRPSMVQRGETYDMVTAAERGGEEGKGKVWMNKLVIDFMAKQAEYEPPLSPRDQWMQDRGFVR